MHVANIQPILKEYDQRSSQTPRKDTGKWRYEQKPFTVGKSGSLVLLWDIGPVPTPTVKALIIGACLDMDIPDRGRLPNGEPFRCWHWTFGGLTDKPKDTNKKMVWEVAHIPRQVGKET